MLSKQLWQSNRELTQTCLKNSFVQGIATGKLERKKFAFYVGQDAFFLEAFARAYSIGAAKTPDWEGFCTFHQLANGVLEELRLHQSYANQWGVNLQDVKPAPATRRYTDFLLATAWGSDIGVTAVAMSPCMRLYAFLGKQLAQNGIPKHQYADWIKTYSSQEFEALAQLLESLCDRYATANDVVRETYRYALLCEEAFFQAAWDSTNSF
ncbi:MAG: TenA family protein [Hydrococcus sp. RU_2_2]|jgi:thiaminase (transcriptional activator TenA)|nr:TenA family protein [Hydrococcus sp. RU_2_2]